MTFSHYVDPSFCYFLRMEEEPITDSPPSPPSSVLGDGEEEEEEEEEESRLDTRRVTVRYRVSISSPSPPTIGGGREEACSCFIGVVAFWAFATVVLMFGFFRPTNLTLGPNTSWLLQPNSMFVQDIKVTSVGSNGEYVALYGFSSLPSLDVIASWCNAVNASVDPHNHKEWTYYLNEGSTINLSYNVMGHHVSPPLILAITQGGTMLMQWIMSPTFADTTLSWHLINGSGEIQQEIFDSSYYYIAIYNIDKIPVEVGLEFSLEARLYDRSGAHYICSLNQCTMKLPFRGSEVAVIATSGSVKNEMREWGIVLAYGPRWVTYFVGSGVMTGFILLAFKIICHIMGTMNTTLNAVEIQPERRDGTVRTPLLEGKEEDCTSLGSSYASISHDEEDEVEADEQHPQGSGSGHSKNICAICFDAPKDCFFLPCGHQATCFTCGVRITQDSGTCPVCRRKIKKPKKIFMV